jgi:hypothetical protein
MEEMIRRYATASIARGCAFGALAIFTVMVGCAADLSLFFRAGGITTLLMCAILIYKASRVDLVPVRSTEVWIMLPKDKRPPAALAKPLIARARREVLLKFAYIAAVIGSVELSADIVLMLARYA